VQWQQSTDGGSTWSDISGATSTTYTTTNVLASDNGDRFRAVFTNVAGSATTNPATLSVTPPPTTNVLLPSNGATIISGSWLDASATSPVGLGIASVVFEVSGNGVNNLVVSSSVPTLYGYLGAWDSSDVANGTYSLQSVATDTLGQSTTSAPITVTVQNPPLNTELLIPSAGATLSGQKAVLDAVASGTSPITGIQFVLSGGSLTDQVVGTAVPTPYGYIALWDTTGVANGSYTLQSEATETGGTTALSAGIAVVVDNPPPTTTVVVPSNNASASGNQYLDATASSGVVQVNYEVSGGPANLSDDVIATGTPTVYGWLAGWNTMGVANGTYTLQSVASYSGGVSGTSAPITVTVSN
jgi:hypothetical protein